MRRFAENLSVSRRADLGRVVKTTASRYREGMIVRFDIRPDRNGWTIFDRATGEPVVIEGTASVGLSFDDADDLVDLLNTLHMLKPKVTLH